LRWGDWYQHIRDKGFGSDLTMLIDDGTPGCYISCSTKKIKVVSGLLFLSGIKEYHFNFGLNVEEDGRLLEDFECDEDILKLRVVRHDGVHLTLWPQMATTSGVSFLYPKFYLQMDAKGNWEIES